MTGTRNLSQAEAADRARLLDVNSYDVSLDLTDGAGNPGDGTFRSVTTVKFTAATPGAGTFIEVAASKIARAELNGVALDTSAWTAETGLVLPQLAEQNTLVVEADFPFSQQGQGLHRAVDPADKEVYLYSQFETADAQKVFACFDQPDLKSVYTWHAVVPKHWKVVSNAPVASVTTEGSGKTVHFEQSARMSTYVTALCAGPYHEVRTTHDGVDMGVFCRASMAEYLEADELFEITKQGFDFFQAQFGVRYPLPKYDQLWVPEFNAGAMENFGCVTHADASYVFRSEVTDYEREQRANTILHELAHMWFGDLVTMRWWDDLWLNESFAEWASHWCNAEATRFSDAWTTFLSVRKNWGYGQDQLSSTHPVYCDMPDVDAVEVNFDGITYAKGASVIKQLVAYVGIDAFVTGLRSYFKQHAWGNATFGDLLSALEAASGRELRGFAKAWLETAQVNTLRPVVEIAKDGTYRQVTVLQTAPESHPTLRPHHLAVGLYDLVDGSLVRRERIETDVAGAETVLAELAGKKAADVLLLNDDDLTYTKLRLDERSLATVVGNLSGFDSSLARALCWAAAWDMVRDAELPARDYVALVTNALPGERDINLVTSTLRQVQLVLTQYADPAWAPAGWAKLADTAKAALAVAEPGSGFQLAWTRAFISAARGSTDLATLQGWLTGTGVPQGIAIAGELRWQLVQCLVANGGVDPAVIQAEHDADRTASGDIGAALAYALIPTPDNKAAVWTELTGPTALPNWRNRALIQGFQHPAQAELTAPYTSRFFADVAGVWAARDSEPAQEFVVLAYPVLDVSPQTVSAAQAWLAEEGHPAPLRRLMAEGNDRVVRALKARAKDAAAS
ncbi:aminopeptidase N [Catellatospora chokoriensis]|uniref:Aminopeptidase N n=1 Tax=Catellatospora chokoriensis TaxID=310353 RepID=A0A8J3KA70_9ACTN|nr:aminopeptidase N [Catellatospora chokoriensis]GIF93510.1 aminopeptidase N [Catellatospora chokoriensis]